MNRREFCQTTALFLAGSVCTGSSLRSEEPAIRFRAQKIFLESWEAENNWHKKLGSIYHNGCHAVLLVPGGRKVSSEEVEKIVSEASRFDLKVFVPTGWTHDLLSQTSVIHPLSHRAGILQVIDSRPMDNGGFLLMDRSDISFGLILYDLSRCRWSGFAALNVGLRHHSGNCEYDSRLVTARWLDHVLSMSNQKNEEAFTI